MKLKPSVLRPGRAFFVFRPKNLAPLWVPPYPRPDCLRVENNIPPPYPRPDRLRVENNVPQQKKPILTRPLRTGTASLRTGVSSNSVWASIMGLNLVPNLGGFGRSQKNGIVSASRCVPDDGQKNPFFLGAVLRGDLQIPLRA